MWKTYDERGVGCEIEKGREGREGEHDREREKKGFLKVRRFCDSNDEKTACVVGFTKNTVLVFIEL